MMHPFPEHTSEVMRGIVGTVFPILGAVTSWQEHLEWGLRIASLVVGILVGLLTLWSLIRKRSD